jgi:hypothetical protein
MQGNDATTRRNVEVRVLRQCAVARRILVAPENLEGSSGLPSTASLR